MTFSEFPYERVDLAAVGAQIDALTRRLQNAASGGEAIACVREYTALNNRWSTTRIIARIRSSVNNNDPFYEAEQKYYAANIPAVSQKQVLFQNAMTSSRFRPDMEKVFPAVAFENADISSRTISPEVLELLSRESKLVMKFKKLQSSLMVDFRGRQYTLSQMIPFKSHPDAAVRRGACEAEGRAVLAVGDQYDDIYDQLVKTRTEIARKLGHDCFTPLGYDRQCRNCYDPAAVESFRRQVREVLVPILTRLKQRQAERLGVRTLHYWDNDLHTPAGNPGPIVQGKELYKAGVQIYRDMNPETARMIDRMDSLQMFDLEARKGKMTGGYCIRLPEYQCPFIFANFNGTAGDLKVFTHEGGHAFAGWLMLHRREPNIDLATTSHETAECHSMSMEFLSWKYWDRFYGPRTEEAQLIHLLNALYFIPYGCMVDHFQHIVYDNPELTPRQRHEKWMELEKQYRPWIDFSDAPFFGEGRGWQRQQHIYTSPFYYIDYALAQTVALEVQSIRFSKDWDTAWDTYYKFTSQFGDDTFVNMLAKAGLHNPFEPGTLENTLKGILPYVEANIGRLG